ncbi:MAG TPA: transferrin receptor-like dimerization domain-containing protein [Gemmatimonadales bacterium]|jgi:N-acetylated-alpha-linked acidic dipeptidase
MATTVRAQQPIRGFPSDALAERARLESALRATPDTARLRQYLSFMSRQPHHAGSARDLAVAQYALARFREWGLEARIDTFQALMPYPVVRRVTMTAPTPFVLQLREPAIPQDSDSRDLGQLPTFNAYSPDGDVSGELVYVNYGIPADYEELARLGVDVRGKIVIARYGGSWRGIKPKVAAEHGAVGCIIYSDPRDDGFWTDDTYPAGPMRPAQGVQRGSVMDMPTYPGDPLTPGWGNRPGGRMLPRDSVTTIEKIPVLPISYGDALPLLRALRGPMAPNDSWKGALAIPYHIGPGPARVHMTLKFDWQVRPLYDVIVTIPGSTDPDQWVIQGNHHDAWVNGAHDPLSGAIATLETARSFAELRKHGWQPRRTIVLALWDGEEWGLLGSTEWAEANADALQTHAVAYFNSDTNNKGALGSSGSHTLESFFREIARDSHDPVNGHDEITERLDQSLSRARTDRDSARIRRDPWRIGALGSGSDYTAFIDHLGIASADLQHGGAQEAGVYHSIYDDYQFYTRFYDPGFKYAAAESGAMGTAIMRLADAPVLPFSFTDAAATQRRYILEIDSLAKRTLPDSLDLSAVHNSVDALAAAGARYDSALAGAVAHGTTWLDAHRAQLTAINQNVYLSERDLISDQGLPRRPWYRHTIYAPGYYTGYGVKTMPGIREAIEQKNSAEARDQAVIVAAAIGRMAARADGAARALAALQ